MQITLQPQGDLIEMQIEGMLDNAAAEHLRDECEKAMGQGRHRILLDLARTTFISSAGVAMLLRCRKQLHDIHGELGVCHPSPPVEQVLRTMRLGDALIRDPERFRSAAAATGALTRLTFARIASQGGVDCEVYHLAPEAELRCRVIGSPQPLFDSGFDERDCRPATFPAASFGIGLGAFGTRFDECRARFGEFVAVAGGVAQLPTHGYATPDYLLASEGFVPEVQVLYGLQCTGKMAHLLRFQPTGDAPTIALNSLVEQTLLLADAPLAGIVILAECHGLVGTTLRRSPAVASAAGERFAHPEIRDWLSFSGEQVHRHSMALIAGVAALGEPPGAAAIMPLLRPMAPESALLGHFHAAVFPFRPLKKRSLELEPSVRQLFEEGGLADVVHLLCDPRPVSGAGDSEVEGGACWVSPITDVAAGDN